MIPAWVDRREYPFEPRGLDVEGGRLSYVDEAEGAPIVIVHGTPTWSFLYRHLIRELSPRYRCLAPDHLGFGLRDRPADWSYRPEDQARNLAWFIETLGVKDRTLMVHDYGGPIGLADALERHYLEPLDGHATWVYARELLGSSVWFDELWRRRDRIARIPAILICAGEPAVPHTLSRAVGPRRRR